MKAMGLCLFTLCSLASNTFAESGNFAQGCWLCISPESYDRAVAESAGKDGAAFDKVKDRFLREKQCTYLAKTDLIKVITSVRILETKGDHARVMFTLQVGDQMPGEQRRESFYRMVVWTARANLTISDE